MKYTLLFLLLTHFAQAQDCTPRDFERLMAEAKRLAKSGEYDKSINKLQSAKTCQPQREAEVNKEVLRVFEQVNGERKKAEAETRRIYANDLAFKSQIALRDGDRTSAFRIAEFAYRYVDKNNDKVLSAMLKSFYYNDEVANSPIPWSSSFEGYDSYITDVTFSPDGTELATSSADGVIKIWNVATKKVVFQSNEGRLVGNITYSPDGKYFAASIYPPLNAIKIWSLTDRKIFKVINEVGTIASIEFSPDSKKIASGFYGGVNVRSVLTGQIINSLNELTHQISSLSYSPDGKFLAIGIENIGNTSWQCKIWNTEDLSAITVQTETSISCVAFSPDGKNVVIGLGNN